jgi:transcriptional regulator with XRE-family HTH domain
MRYSDAEEIRQRYRDETISQEDLALEYHVNRSTISRILNGEIWRHPTDKAEYRRLGSDGPTKDRLIIEQGFCKSKKVWGKLLYGH